LVAFAAILSPRRKNGCIVESCIYGSRITGWRAWIKRFVLRRCSVAYPSGKSQSALVKALGFNGRIVEWGGCGLLNYQPQPAYMPRVEVKTFLYVGRLAPEKSLPLLIEAFRRLPNLQLDIIGFGPQEELLKSIAPKNVHLLSAIDNKKLPQYYQSHDCFILPSNREPWGLVVEEALNNGCPVIVSDCVGCKDDLVTPGTGLVFESGNIDSLCNAIERMTDVRFYNALRLGISHLDFRARARRQVKAFT